MGTDFSQSCSANLEYPSGWYLPLSTFDAISEMSEISELSESDKILDQQVVQPAPR